ncbi:MAG: hypothetical protein ACXAB4_04145 [Candidatus Hodarchaeales archaeon]|jgi:hypothetical protein
MPDIIEILNLVIFAANIFLIVFILGMMFNYYRKKPYNTYIFLMFATLFFLLQELISRVFLPQEEPAGEEEFVDFLEIVVPISLLLISLTGATFFLVLFFQSFESSKVLTERNLILTLLFTVLTSGLLISTLQLAVTLPELEGQSDEEIFEAEPWPLIFPTMLFGIFSLGCLFFLIAMIVRIFLKLRRRIRATTNPIIKNKLKKMRYAVIGMLFADMISDLIFDLTGIVLGGLLPILALGYFIYLYSTSGTFILPAQSLQKFIIIGKEGLPLHSYNFQPEEGDGLSFDSQDVLFSGALKAISNLFSEFTGKMDQALKEVTFESVVVMANQIANQRFLAVLLVDHSTRFFQEAFENTTQQLDLLVSNFKLHPGKTLAIPEIMAIDKTIERNFGGGFQRNYDSLAS